MPPPSGPDRAEQPDGEPDHVTQLALAAVHGGAGVTTLASLLRSEGDLGVFPRHGLNWLADRVQGRPLILVARNTVAAAGGVMAAINAIDGQGGHAAVLAVVSDGLPEPKAAVYRYRLLAQRVDGLVRVPFVASLRASDDPSQVSLPRAAHRALAEIRALAAACAAGHHTARTRRGA